MRYFCQVGLRVAVDNLYCIIREMANKKRKYSQRQLDFIQWYTSPASPTYDNIKQSAIKAGYTESYASGAAYRSLVKVADEHKKKLQKVTDKTVDRSQFYNDLLRDAEKGIAERVRMDTKGDSKLIGIQQKDQHFVTERIGREQWHTKNVTENKGFSDTAVNTLANLANNLAEQLGEAKNEPIRADYEINEAENGDISDEKEGT